MSEIQPSIPAAAAAADPALSGPARLSPQERLREITAGIEQGIQDLFSSERYAQYLRTMSHFHRYSLNNTMLIYMQRPDATLVAGFNKWRDQFGRHVNRGEKSIKIIAPVPVTVTQTREKRDPIVQALDGLGGTPEVLEFSITVQVHGVENDVGVNVLLVRMGRYDEGMIAFRETH